MKTTIRRHPVVAYFLLVYAIAWIGSFVVMGPKFLRGEEILLTDLLIIGVPMLAAPTLAGITLTAVVDGKRGLQKLFQRMIHWRVEPRWYAALLIFPILILVVYRALYFVASPEFVLTFFAFGFQMGLAAGFLEEVGWMGFAFPHMRTSRSVFVAAVLLGLLHSLWHLAAGYLGASTVRGVYFLPHFLAFSVAMTAMRVLVVWVYVNTESVLLAQLMHASSTGFLAVLIPMTLAPLYDTLFYAVYAIVLWLAVALVVARYGKDLAVGESWSSPMFGW